MTDIVYSKMSNIVKMDYKEFLIQKYNVELLSTREIGELVGTFKSTIGYHLKDLGIELRHGSEAVKTQWLNNDSRKKHQAEFAKIKFSEKQIRAKLKATMQTDEYKQKQRVAKLGDKNAMFGKTRELSPKWNPNLSDDERIIKRNTFENYQWRKKVFERDKFTCKKCGDDKGHNLNAHHIINHCKNIELRYNVDNGITLCKECHKAFHKQYGYKDNNEIQLNEFLNK